MDRQAVIAPIVVSAVLAASLIVGAFLDVLSDVVQLATVALLGLTLVFTFYQQTKLMRAEMLRDSFGMCWRTLVEEAAGRGSGQADA